MNDPISERKDRLIKELQKNIKDGEDSLVNDGSYVCSKCGRSNGAFHNILPMIRKSGLCVACYND